MVGSEGSCVTMPRFGQRVHREAQERGEEYDLAMTQRMAGGRCADPRVCLPAVAVEPHHAGAIRHRLHPGEGQHDPDEAVPVAQESSVQRLDVVPGPPRCGMLKSGEEHDDDGGRHRDQEREAARMLGPNQFSPPMSAIASAANVSGCGTPRY